MSTPSIFRFNDFYGLSLLEWKRTKLVFKILRACLLDFIHSATAWVQLFLISEKSVIGTSRHKRYEKDSWIYGLSKSAVNKFFTKSHFGFCLYVFAYRSIHLAMHLVQTQSIQSRCSTNILRHLFFLFTPNNYTSGNRNSFAVSLLIKVRIETTIFFYS